MADLHNTVVVGKARKALSDKHHDRQEVGDHHKAAHTLEQPNLARGNRGSQKTPLPVTADIRRVPVGADRTEGRVGAGNRCTHLGSMGVVVAEDRVHHRLLASIRSIPGLDRGEAPAVEPMSGHRDAALERPVEPFLIDPVLAWKS